MTHTYRVLFHEHTPRILTWPHAWEFAQHDDLLDPLSAAAYRAGEDAFERVQQIQTPDDVLSCAQHVWGAPSLPQTLMRMGAFERYAPHAALDPSSLSLADLEAHPTSWTWGALLHAMHPDEAPAMGLETLRMQAIQLSAQASAPDPKDLVQAAHIPLLCLRWLSEASGMTQGTGQDRIARAFRRAFGVVGIWGDDPQVAATAASVMWRADVYARSGFEGPEPPEGQSAPHFIDQSYRVVVPRGWLGSDLSGVTLQSDAP